MTMERPWAGVNIPVGISCCGIDNDAVRLASEVASAVLFAGVRGPVTVLRVHSFRSTVESS